MSLPPLPERYMVHGFFDLYTADQMHAYAAAARLAALEEAADVCDQHASCEGIAEKCAAAIRALAIHVCGTCTDSGEK